MVAICTDVFILTKVEKIKLVNSCWWWHHIDLGDGIITPGHQGEGSNATRQHLDWIQLPDLTNKTVLDIGCSDGFYSFECEKRGALVTALDDPKLNQRMDNFRLVKTLLNSNATLFEGNLFEICPKSLGKFDIVLALGLLYHLKSFYIGLEIIKQLAKELVIIQSIIAPENSMIINVALPQYPLDHFTWYPSESLLLEVLKHLGFTVTLVNRYCESGVFIHAVP